MTSWRSSVQIASSPSSVGLTASGAVGAVALALVLGLGGCATKPRSPAPPGNIEGANASAGTGARSSKPIATPAASTADATQPGGASADSSSSLAGERSEPSAASANVSGERGEPASGNASSSASPSVSGEHGDLATAEGASSASGDISGERGAHSGVGDNAAQPAQSATAGEAGAATTPVASQDGAASSQSDEKQPAGQAAGSVTGESGTGTQSAAATGSAQGETGAEASTETERGHTVGAAAVAPGTSGDNAKGMSGAAPGDATTSAAPAGGQDEGSSAAAGGAGAQVPGAVGGAPESRGGIGGGVAGLEGSEGAGASGERLAAVDVPSSKVNVDEEYRPQTLGGMLPLVLGVNEDGRFDFDQYVLRDEVKTVLDQLAVKLTSADYDRLDIIGYTDHIGTPEYNQRLSELRAWSVAQYLLSKGVPENKIHYEGRGEKNPVTRPDECTGLARDDLIACLQKDRRVEIEASIRRKHATVTQ